MFIKEFACNVKQNNKIFRPWDTSSAVIDIPSVKDCSQDNTISTTTKNNNHNDISSNSDSSKGNSKGFRPIKSKTKSQPPQTEPEIYPVDFFNAAYPDLLQAHLGQSIGLPSSDPVLLETLSQGIALEEYMRVLSQEQHEKMLASKKQRPKKYKCPHCDVGFSNNGQLKGHIRIHTGERPFKCEEKDCGKTFTRNEELTRHKRIHSGLRPFPCTHCGKRFGRKDHLKKHSRTHFQTRGLYAVPVMLPFETWASSSSSYPFVPMFGY